MKKLSLWLCILMTSASCSFTPFNEKPPVVEVDAPIAVPPPPDDAVDKSPHVPAGDGKYYLDDGPPDGDDSARLANVPDAIVRWQPISPKKNRPYEALGKRYTPFRQLRPYRKQGFASWYGRRYHGRQTASGEIYDMYRMTAAHPILPIPSYARVTRVDTGKSVVVRINDRGPFLQNRLIDLSYAAAARLDYVRSGTAEVIVELLLPADADIGDPGDAVETEPVDVPVTAKSGAVYIQLAAFGDILAANDYIRQLKKSLSLHWHDKLSVEQKTGEIYAVQVGAYDSRRQATDDDRILCLEHALCGFLTQR